MTDVQKRKGREGEAPDQKKTKTRRREIESTKTEGPINLRGRCARPRKKGTRLKDKKKEGGLQLATKAGGTAASGEFEIMPKN